MIAAYVIVLGALVGYGVWVALQRRALTRRPRSGTGGTASERGGSS